MRKKVHNKAIPNSLVTRAESAINTQLKAFTPYATPLTAEERRGILKTGPSTFEFVELAYILAKENPGFTSKSFDMNAFAASWNDFHNLQVLENRVRLLSEMISDLIMTAGSAVQHHALELYTDVKAATARNIPEARTIYEVLKAAYPDKGRKHRKKPAEQT